MDATEIMDLSECHGTKADEVGTPESALEYCGDHDVTYRTWGRCLECVREDPDQEVDP